MRQPPLVFFVRSWQELSTPRAVGKLRPDLIPLVDTWRARRAYQYRIFRFDESGAIKAAFVFLKIDASLADVPADTDWRSLEAAQTILSGSDTVFRDHRFAPWRSSRRTVGSTLLPPRHGPPHPPRPPPVPPRLLPGFTPFPDDPPIRSAFAGIS